MKPALILKSRILNILRKLLSSNYVVENFLLKKTLKYGAHSLWQKLIVPYYAYPKKTMRLAIRTGVKFNLDLSNLVEYVIYWYGCVDENQSRLLADIMENSVVIDVGVNIGGTLLPYAKKAVFGKVIGFEPDSINYKKALENISLNEFKNIELFKGAVGDKEGFVELYRIDDNNPGMNRILSGNRDLPHEKVKIITLDNFVLMNKLERVDVIKIDTEGFEMNVLRGAEQILRKFKPILFIELSDLNLREQGLEPIMIIKYLWGLGYEIRDADSGDIVSITHDFSLCHMDILCKLIK